MTDLQGADQPVPGSSPEQPNGLVNEGTSAPQNVDDQGVQKPQISEGAEKRINDLIGKFKGSEERARALELEIAELRGRVSQGEQVQDEWSQLSDMDLLTVSAQEDATADQKAEALKRYHQRQEQKLSKLTEGQEAREQLQANISKTWESIREDFGPEVDNKASPIYSKALEVYEQYRAKYGGQQVDTDPRYQRMAFEVASSQMSTSNDSRVAELEAELAKYKQGETIEAAGNLAAQNISRENRSMTSGNANAMGRELAKKLLGGPPVM
jgi:hypothetical protein